jgi:methionine aminopeptidase
VNGKPKAFGILLKKQPNALIGSTAEKLRLWMTMKQHPMGKDKKTTQSLQNSFQQLFLKMKARKSIYNAFSGLIGVDDKMKKTDADSCYKNTS